MLNNDFVIIPRKQYESLLRTKTTNYDNAVVKRSASFKVPKRHEKFYNQLDKELTATLREVNEGKVVGPFDNVKDLMKSLKS